MIQVRDMAPLGRALASAMLAIAALETLARGEPPERAPAPKFSDADVGPFFVDAREALVGQRPDDNGSRPLAAADPPGSAAEDDFRWSTVVSTQTLETEVKRVAGRLAAPLASSAAFKTTGHLACRAELTMLAALMAVIEQYDGKVRWQQDAAALRDAAARAADACRAGSDESYAAASALRDQLAAAIRGDRGEAAPTRPLDRWSAIADRPLLMQRMQRALREGIEPHLADARALSRAKADVVHEAELLALLGEIIHREDFEFWDDATFVQHAQEMGTSASELGRAAGDDQYDAARRAAGKATNSCAACHDGYRG